MVQHRTEEFGGVDIGFRMRETIAALSKMLNFFTTLPPKSEFFGCLSLTKALTSDQTLEEVVVGISHAKENVAQI